MHICDAKEIGGSIIKKSRVTIIERERKIKRMYILAFN